MAITFKRIILCNQLPINKFIKELDGVREEPTGPVKIASIFPDVNTQRYICSYVTRNREEERVERMALRKESMCCK